MKLECRRGRGGTGRCFLYQCRRGTAVVAAEAVPHVGAVALGQSWVPCMRGAALEDWAAVGFNRGIGPCFGLYNGSGIATSNMAGSGRGGGQLIRDPDINRLDRSHHVAGAIGFQKKMDRRGRGRSIMGGK
ncbi:hypothetical protein PIB30_104212 [Stylosanthes scabra]|uniref:Uncharacterized protein n=1 Tax=Stylosanthes scabra TaxID=79078 RepID=A0ABU6ZWU7_9FABA|nr:hypothetical protein [Stylosanthes scabra]